MVEVTYGRLEQALLALGFSLRGVVEQNKRFIHEPTGALMALPDVPLDTPAQPRHVGGVRHVLTSYGLAEPTDFDRQLHMAS